MVLGLPTPSERQCFVSASVSDPPAFRREFGFLREKAARESDVHARARKLHGRARNAGRGRRQRNTLFARGRGHGNGDIKQQDRPTRMGKECGELASRFAAGIGHERNEFAVESCFANQQTRRNRDAYPAVLQDIDCQTRTAGSEFAINA